MCIRDSFYSELAAANKVVLVTSLFEKRAPGLYHNTAVVFDRDGSIAGKCLITFQSLSAKVGVEKIQTALFIPVSYTHLDVYKRQDIQTVIVTAVTGVYLPLILNLFLRIISYNCVMNLLIVNSCHSH